MVRPSHIRSTSPVRRRCPFCRAFQAREGGHSLIELLTALALLGICLAAGVTVLSRGASAVEARGAAQTWQAAVAWAQSGAVWSGMDADLEFESGKMTVRCAADRAGGDLGAAAPSVVAVPNIAGWRQGEGVTVGFSGGTAYPTSAGSVFFRAPGGDYRVTVRLESGLTVRTRMEAAP